MKIHRAIRKFVEHPITNLSVGLVLFGSGFAEAYGSMYTDFANMNIGAHHGLMVFGFINVLASIPDLIEGVSSGVSYFEHRADRDRHSGRGE